jgi:hypothetical protein
VTFIPLLNLFDSVAKAFDAAFQANTLTFGGTDERQILDQHGCSPFGIELAAGRNTAQIDSSGTTYMHYVLKMRQMTRIGFLN